MMKNNKKKDSFTKIVGKKERKTKKKTQKENEKKQSSNKIKRT